VVLTIAANLPDGTNTDKTDTLNVVFKADGSCSKGTLTATPSASPALKVYQLAATAFIDAEMLAGTWSWSAWTWSDGTTCSTANKVNWKVTLPTSIGSYVTYTAGTIATTALTMTQIANDDTGRSFVGYHSITVEAVGEDG